MIWNIITDLMTYISYSKTLSVLNVLFYDVNLFIIIFFYFIKDVYYCRTNYI